MTITDEHVKHFKKMNKIYHSHEDEMIKELLKASYYFIESKCGAFNMDKNRQGAELVYNRSRYAYNESVEFFDQNFMSLVTSFSLSNLKDTQAGDEDG